MTEQTFRGPVGQVAGRDILNFGPLAGLPLSERSTEWLSARRQHCERKLAAARQTLMRDYALPLMLVGIVVDLVLIWMLVTGLLPVRAIWLMLAWLVLTTSVPAYRFDVLRRREAAVIKHYQRELQAIDIVLYDRSEPVPLQGGIGRGRSR